MNNRSVELAELPRQEARRSAHGSSLHKDDGDEQQPPGDEYRLIEQHQFCGWVDADVENGGRSTKSTRKHTNTKDWSAEDGHKHKHQDIEATSFHRPDEEQTESPDKHEYLLFSFRNFGILINVILGPILIIANAVIVQVLEDRRKVNTGSIMCIRSLIVLAVIGFQSRNTNMISLDFGPDKQTVMGCALALAVSNFAFILCLTNISIAAAFALIVMINPLSLLFTKQWKFRYTWTELGILLSCVVGIAVMGIPWASRQTGGICIGVACLLINYMYQAERNNLTQPVPLIKFIYLSNVISAVLGLVFMVFIGLQLIDWVSLLMIAGGAICYLLGIELIHRVNATFHDEFVHIIYYLYIVIGFLFDSTLGLKNTEQYDLIGAVLILVASYYGKNMVIVGNFWNMVRYGTPSPPSLFDDE